MCPKLRAPQVVGFGPKCRAPDGIRLRPKCWFRFRSGDQVRLNRRYHKKRKYETAGIAQTTGAKFHRQEDKRQQTASEQCSTASNPLSDADQLWFRDCQAKKREQEDQVRDLHESIGHYSMMLRRMEEKSMRTLSETGEQHETGTHSTLPAAEAPTQTEAALRPMMQPPRQLQKRVVHHEPQQQCRHRHRHPLAGQERPAPHGSPMIAAATAAAPQ